MVPQMQKSTLSTMACAFHAQLEQEAARWLRAE